MRIPILVYSAAIVACLPVAALAQTPPLAAGSALRLSVGGVVEDGHPGPIAGADLKWTLGSIGELDASGQVGRTDVPINQALGAVFVGRMALTSSSALAVGVSGQRVELSDNVVSSLAPAVRLTQATAMWDLKASFGTYSDRNDIVPDADYRGVELDEESSTFFGHRFGTSLSSRVGDIALSSTQSSGTHMIAVIEPGLSFDVGHVAGQMVAFRPSVQLLVQRVDLNRLGGTVTSNRTSNAINLLFSITPGAM